MDFLEESDSEPGPEICDVLNNCSIIVDRAHADVDGGLVIERDNKASQLEPDHSASVLNMLSVSVPSTPGSSTQSLSDNDSSASAVSTSSKRKRTGDPEKRKARNNARKESRKTKKGQLSREKETRDRLSSASVLLQPEKFQKTDVVHTEMNPDVLRKQNMGFLALPSSKDKLLPSNPALSVTQAAATTSPITPKSSNKTVPVPNCDPLVLSLVNDEGYQYIANNDKEAQVIADKHGRIFFVKVKPPSDASSKEMHRHVEGLVNKMCERINALAADPNAKGCPKAQSNNRHVRPEDCFRIIFGLTFPQGGRGPAVQNIDPILRPFVEELLANPWIQKFMNFITACFISWFPRHAFAYDEVKHRLKITTNAEERANNIFKNSRFCGTTFNLGPYAITLEHRDSRNLVGGLCVLGVFGQFDHKTSGHFIMKEPKVVIELRRGDVVFMPSAGITHRNAGMKKGETRSSIIQYTAGGLFQWIWQGFRQLSKSDINVRKGFREREGRSRWKEMWGLFPSLEELEEAKRSGRLPLGDYPTQIQVGDSFLFPPKPNST